MNAQRKAVVFGGSGFIGTHLLRRLAKAGWKTLSADLVSPSKPTSEHQLVDVRQEISLHGDWAGATIFNLAAVHRTPGHAEHEYFETNVWGALNVTEWAEKAGCETMVFTSSIAVYGAGEDLKTEKTPPAPNIAYGRSKLLAERVHERWRDSAAARRLIVVRPAVVFGPGENGNFTRLAAALGDRRFFYPGRTDTVKSCGFVEDLVDSMLFALDDAPSLDLYNFCYPEQPTIEAICRTFHEVAGFALPRSIPSTPVRWGLNAPIPGMERLQERARKLVTSTNIAPEALRRHGFAWKTDLEAALRSWQASSNGSFQ